jgi:hypothetical protein
MRSPNHVAPTAPIIPFCDDAGMTFPPAGWAPDPNRRPEPEWAPTQQAGEPIWYPPSAVPEPSQGTRRWVIIAAIAAATAAIIAVVIALSVSGDSGPSDQLIYDAIKPGNSSQFTSDGQPLFSITKVVEPQSGWYVAWIKRTDIELETARVVLRQNDPPDGPMVLVLGPGTNFPASVTTNIPESVREVLTEN